jgi:hypothetical protein
MLLTAAAAQADEFGGEGSYLTISGIAGIDVDSGDGYEDDGGGFSARAGGYITPNVVLEVQYDFVSDVGSLVTTNVKLVWGTSRFQPFLDSGIGFGSIDHSGVHGIWRAGGGVDVFLNDSWKLTADASFVDTLNGGEPLRHVVVGLGLGYQFF